MPPQAVYGLPRSDLIAASPISGYISGFTYGSVMLTGTNGTIPLNTLYAQPFYVGPPTYFNGIVIASLGVASSFCRVGIYADSAGRPRELIVDAGQIDGSTNGEKIATISQRLSGIVWLSAVGQGVAPSLTRQYNIGDPRLGLAAGERYSVGNVVIAYSQAGVSGALPNPWGSTYTGVVAANTVPCIYLRAA